MDVLMMMMCIQAEVFSSPFIAGAGGRELSLVIASVKRLRGRTV